jgi:hypothetical protein
LLNQLRLLHPKTRRRASAVVTSCAETTNRQWHIEEIRYTGTEYLIHIRPIL